MPQKKKKKKDEDEMDESAIDYSPFTIDNEDADGDETTSYTSRNRNDLVLRNLETGEEIAFHNVLEYYFSKTGEKLLMEQAKNPKDSLSQASSIACMI